MPSAQPHLMPFPHDLPYPQGAPLHAPYHQILTLGRVVALTFHLTKVETEARRAESLDMEDEAELGLG